MNMNDGFRDQLELARLLAKFKLGVRRQLALSVSLERLQNEPGYAREQFAALEERIDDEDLLTTLLTLRERLVPAPTALAPPSQADAEPGSTRYRFGPRG
jgi:hypothetical protein